MAIVFWLLACVSGSPDDEGRSWQDELWVSLEPGDTGEWDPYYGRGEPSDSVDVLVIGSGGAGLAAAWSATEAGASVLVLEREAVAGGSSEWAQYYWAAETAYQAERDITDSVAAALDDWDAATGGDGSDPLVEAYVAASAEVIAWLVEDVGGELRSVVGNAATDEVERLHALRDEEDAPVHTLVEWMDADTRLEHTVTELVEDRDGRIVGAAWAHDGEEGWIAARATVIATGGFARDLERVRWDRPELEGVDVLFDHGPTVDGGGLPLLDQVDADWQNRGHIGLYIHGTRDWRTGYEDELLFLEGLSESAIVTVDGERVDNEVNNHGYTFAEHLVEAPEQTLFAVWTEAHFMTLRGFVSGYNPLSDDGNKHVSASDILAEGAAVSYADIAELAAGTGIDEDGLVETLALCDEVWLGDALDPFGKDAEDFLYYGDAPLVVARLYPSVNKAFSGARIDEQARVLDASGEVIAGLYAAGEVTGMLGTEAIGDGYSGSITAVYWTGLLAGEMAAASE